MSVLYVRDKDGNLTPVHTIKGEDGNTPVKGTDYWTEEDKAEIVEQAAELIDIPTKVSELENDSGYLTEHQSLDGYATETFVTTKIAEAQLADGEVDMSGYATMDDIPTKVSELENDSGFITEHQSLDGYVTSETATAVNYGATTPEHFVNGEVFLTPLGGDPATKEDIEKIAAPHSLIYGKMVRVTDEEIDAVLNALYNDATFPNETFRYYILSCNSDNCAIEKGAYLMEIYKQSYRYGFIVIRRAADNKLTEYKRVYRNSVFSAWKDCSTLFT